ncbi:MAG: hypothetical protein KAT00_01460 [Planctomycetes bacterium]|nr:hypothetical protein [Planctomycetota bacterium]
MTKQEVIDLMKSSKSEEEWNNNCAKMRAACGGWPPFWYEVIVSSGLAQ